MEYSKYLEHCNTTWGDQTPTQEMIHCQLSVPEEIGEILGVYKKHFGYGKPKDDAWKTKLVEEAGDLIYYITKTSDVFHINISTYYLPEFLVEAVDMGSIKTVREFFIDMLDSGTEVLEGTNRNEIQTSLESVLMYLLIILKSEDISLEYVQYANIAKLKKRHGDKFNTEAIMDEGRNKSEELKAVKDA